MNFFALIQNHEMEVRRIRLQQGFQRELTAEFENQRRAFFEGVEILEFDPRYKPDDDEVFVIAGFDLPDYIANAIHNINQVANLSLEPEVHIKAIFGVDQGGERNSLRACFQGFMQRRLLVGGWTLLLQGDTYRRMEDPGLLLDSGLVAVYEEGKSLYFRSYTLVNRFLDLTPHFAEATDGDIRGVLSDEKLRVDDANAVIECADSIMRKRFMAVKMSGVLSQVTVRKIQRQARKFGIDVRTEGGQILFPAERKGAKEILRLLLEGYYEGVLTGTRFMTNSQKRLEN